MSSSEYPPEKRIDKWKTLYTWLQFPDEEKMVCKICSSQKDRICSMPNFNFNFILGSTNFQPSALKEHDASRFLINQFVKKEHEEAAAALRSLPPRKVKQQAPSNSSIVPGIKLIGDLEHDSVRKLQETAFYIPLKVNHF